MEECSWVGKTAHLTHPQQRERQRLYKTWANPSSFISRLPGNTEGTQGRAVPAPAPPLRLLT